MGTEALIWKFPTTENPKQCKIEHLMNNALYFDSSADGKYSK